MPIFCACRLVKRVRVKEHKNLISLVSETVESLGYAVWQVETVSSSNELLLKVYIEPADYSLATKQSVNIDDCSKVANQLKLILATEESTPSSYSLEVSSPGVERQLYEPRHYLRYLGGMISLQTLEPLGEKKKFVGKLTEVSDDAIELMLENQEKIRLEYTVIAKSRLVSL